MDVNMSIHESVAMILAAGFSTRMGQPKALLPWGEGTVLDHVMGQARQAGAQTLVVLGFEPSFPITGDWVRNVHASQGIASSIQCGLTWIRRHKGLAPVLVLLADQPFVTSDDILWTWKQFVARSADVHAVRPLYEGLIGHPVIFDAAFDAAIFQLEGDRGLGKIWNTRPDTLSLKAPPLLSRPHPSFDLDTPTDYARALSLRKWNQEPN
ncbi:molybdenum cofactor cytidylyltransferase [Sulfobacillus thermosulfidooxidans DSM 9293]|uniref:Molybdenum cofactor cytidylyltransferase n=1 Tax=Sulfobacillus thermosulfidooxidans (strain DSM 9293 / VKM B-1269 / AT-1) TaxID=929705 RepID=A0A1W1WIG8_SULTA|nr:nucleotidyltransferase family protein [Sulfobacillus thermosulfidooxidans]SMC05830.1 molybdenum cofactor cytidylyltransferase [Sulfobacillus thermosulfidooxidans DSM 9293]